jgi:hypothetical protein
MDSFDPRAVENVFAITPYGIALYSIILIGIKSKPFIILRSCSIPESTFETVPNAMGGCFIDEAKMSFQCLNTRGRNFHSDAGPRDKGRNKSYNARFHFSHHCSTRHEKTPF